MKARGLTVLTVLVLTWLLAGCAAAPSTPEAAAATAQKFLEARAAGDAAALHGLLTARAAEALTEGDVARALRGEQFQYGRVGTPVTRPDGWVQVPVSDYRVAGNGQDVRWPEVRLTLRYEEKRWRVGWVEPLADKARRAYENSQYGEELDLAKAIIEIDPFHYRGPLEVHFAYRGLKRAREAEVAILRAAELATPYQQPDVSDAFGRFKLSLGHPEDAVAHARTALEKAAPFAPALYSARWQADTLVMLGRALLLRGDRAGAAAAADQAAAADPGNAGLSILRRSLAAPATGG